MNKQRNKCKSCIIISIKYNNLTILLQYMYIGNSKDKLSKKIEVKQKSYKVTYNE